MFIRKDEKDFWFDPALTVLVWHECKILSEEAGIEGIPIDDIYFSSWFRCDQPYINHLKYLVLNVSFFWMHCIGKWINGKQ